MKKVIAFALAMVMCLAAFAGCGSKEVDLKGNGNTQHKVQPFT